MRPTHTLWTIGLLMLTLAGLPARATPLGDHQISTKIDSFNFDQVYAVHQYVPGEQDSLSYSGYGATADAFASVAGATLLQGRANSTTLLTSSFPEWHGSPGITWQGAEGDASLSYQFEILGPQTVFVPLLIQAHVQVVTTGPEYYSYDQRYALATALFSVTQFAPTGKTGDGGFAQSCTNNYQCYPWPSSIFENNNGSGRLYTSNLPIYLLEEVDAIADGPDYSAFASVDSVSIRIDPDFLAQNPGYRLVFSQGVGSVPEPAAWMMMTGGFGLIGAALRRRSPAASPGH